MDTSPNTNDCSQCAPTTGGQNSFPADVLLFGFWAFLCIAPICCWLGCWCWFKNLGSRDELSQGRAAGTAAPIDQHSRTRVTQPRATQVQSQGHLHAPDARTLQQDFLLLLEQQQQQTARILQQQRDLLAAGTYTLQQQQKISSGDVMIDIVDECAICLTEGKGSSLSPPWMWTVLPGCQHMFHSDCIQIWLAINPICPLCRNKVPPFTLS